MQRNGSQDLDYAILQALHTNRQPMGSWSLYYFLRERGHRISAPTIGRRLRDLERRNLLRRVTMEGRIIAPSGERLLRKADHERRVQASEQKFLSVLKSNSRKDIVDQLMVRRIIEGESAAQAALNISRKSLAKLAEIVQRQKTSVRRGEMGVEEDVGFHEKLAQASGNKVLASMVHLLRSQEWMNYAVAAIRAKVGTRLAVDHEEILDAMKTRNATLARKAMENHISKLIADVERYWEQVFRRGSKT